MKILLIFTSLVVGSSIGWVTIVLHNTHSQYTEAEFMDLSGTKVFRIYLRAIHSLTRHLWFEWWLMRYNWEHSLYLAAEIQVKAHHCKQLLKCRPIQLAICNFHHEQNQPLPSFPPAKLGKWASRSDLLVFVSSVVFCTVLNFTAKKSFALAAAFYAYQCVRSLSVSFFIEKEPRKQLRMKRKRKGER